MPEPVPPAMPRIMVSVEGILIFADKALRDLMDVKIFVDTDADVRILRRILRDVKEHIDHHLLQIHLQQAGEAAVHVLLIIGILRGHLRQVAGELVLSNGGNPWVLPLPGQKSFKECIKP